MRYPITQYQRLIIDPPKNEVFRDLSSRGFYSRSIPGRNQVDVWFISFDSENLSVDKAYAVLSQQERERAERFRSEKHRREYVLAHGFLRETLSSYVSVPPEELSFERNEFGKPALRTNRGGQTLCFNLSHSSGAAVCAVSGGCRVGIGMERVSDVPQCEQIVERFFSVNEADAFRATPSKAKSRAFLACWTRKEAYGKAKGTGLSLLELKSMDVMFARSPFAAQAWDGGDEPTPDQWAFLNLDFSDEYVVALVIERSMTH